MAFDLKGATPDTGLPSTGFLFGADSQAATDPSIYSLAAVITAVTANLASADVITWNGDTFLLRDAANAVALRNGNTAQNFRAYNKYTDASNYERGIFGFSADTFYVGTERAGTGVARNVFFVAGGSTVALMASTAFRSYQNFEGSGDNLYDLGTTTRYWKNLFQKGYHELIEMTAPAAAAANGVRIFAQDNGAGKTQLMAIFATGAAQQIAIEP